MKSWQMLKYDKLFIQLQFTSYSFVPLNVATPTPLDAVAGCMGFD
jgi:hypothetical protein